MKTAPLTHEGITFKQAGKYHNLSDILESPLETRRIRMTLISNDKCCEVFKLMKQNVISDAGDQIRQFVNCNLAAIDRIEDIDERGNVNIENVPCEFKAANKHCPHAIAGNAKPYCIKKF